VTHVTSQRDDRTVAIELGHQQVHHDEIELLCRGDVHGVPSVDGLEHAIPVAFEQQPHQTPCGPVVVDNQHGVSRGRRVTLGLVCARRRRLRWLQRVIGESRS